VGGGSVMRPGFQNPHFKPHRDLGTMSKTDAQYDALKAKIRDYLKHADREGRPTVLTTELRALDPDFAAGNRDRERLFAQLSWDLGLTPTEVPDE
jgi:hypothetical protein